MRRIAGHPAEHWSHLRTTNPIETTFAMIRLRHRKTKGNGPCRANMTMKFKFAQSAPKKWRRLLSHLKVTFVIAARTFNDGLIRMRSPPNARSQNTRFVSTSCVAAGELSGPEHPEGTTGAAKRDAERTKETRFSKPRAASVFATSAPKQIVCERAVGPTSAPKPDTDGFCQGLRLGH